MRGRAGVRAVDQEAHDAAERKQSQRRRKGEESGIAPRPGLRRAKGASEQRTGEDQRRRGDAELQISERLALMVGERSEDRVERRRRERNERDETNRSEEGAFIDGLFAEA